MEWPSAKPHRKPILIEIMFMQKLGMNNIFFLSKEALFYQVWFLCSLLSHLVSSFWKRCIVWSSKHFENVGVGCMSKQGLACLGAGLALSQRDQCCCMEPHALGPHTQQAYCLVLQPEPLWTVSQWGKQNSFPLGHPTHPMPAKWKQLATMSSSHHHFQTGKLPFH